MWWGSDVPGNSLIEFQLNPGTHEMRGGRVRGRGLKKSLWVHLTSRSLEVSPFLTGRKHYRMEIRNNFWLKTKIKPFCKKNLKKTSVFYDWWFWRLCKDTERWSKSWDATVTTCCCCGESWYCLCINREQIHDFRAKNREIRLNASDTHTASHHVVYKI